LLWARSRRSIPERIEASVTEPKQGGEFDEHLYSINDSQAQQEYLGGRRADKWISFFLPHLRPGMALLDCGCGVGSITLDLAERVAPGQVVGIDLDESQLNVARESAKQRQIQNVRFEIGNVYHLKDADASFDAVLAHTLLMHLNDPLRAMREMRRVLKLGGVVGIADDDYGTLIWSPQNPLMDRFWQIWTAVVQFNGGSPYYSRNLRGLLREAGFARTEGHAVAADYYGTLDETRRFARVVDRLLHDPALVEIMLGQGYTNQAELEAVRANFKAWGDDEDAFFAFTYCAAVGWNAG
jgi:SAM-dependent methyltransferase